VVVHDGRHDPTLPRGNRDGTLRKRGVERGRPRPLRVATATAGTRPQAKARRAVEESDEPIVPLKATKAAGGKGLYSNGATPVGKERRLWRF
jgi:hypothetical protein